MKMRSRDRNEQATQVAAWVLVMLVHAGIFWLLAQQQQRRSERETGQSLRLAFIALPPTSAPEQPVRPVAAPRLRRASPRAQLPAMVPDVPPVEPAGASSDPLPGPEQLQQQVSQWAREQAGPAFPATPFRSRCAQLPGGERPGAFRMKEPWSPSRVVAIVGRAFGDRDPCPSIRSRLSGLLASTSDHDRELLHEELRRDREYCQP
ncbi:hypothetical protein [Pseudoxanthomonas gei]|nr:hypothetical protein [Pseudoxanthomonas gei]